MSVEQTIYSRNPLFCWNLDCPLPHFKRVRVDLVKPEPARYYCSVECAAWSRKADSDATNRVSKVLGRYEEPDSLEHVRALEKVEWEMRRETTKMLATIQSRHSNYNWAAALMET